MTKKIGDKKLGGVKSTTHATEVDTTRPVGSVTSIKPAGGVGGITGPSAIGKRRATRLMTLEEREQLLQMINEEADKMFKSGVIPPQKKEVVAKAVKMAIDASILTEKETTQPDKEKKRSGKDTTQEE